VNIVIIVVDGLRADRLSMAGYPRPTSPFLDELARGGASFERFFTPATPTLPALTSLFTGQHPVTHRVVTRKGDHDLSPHAPWLPEVLLSRGYDTCAIDNLADRKVWAGRGFKTYLNLRRSAREYLDCFRMNRAAKAWIDEGGDRPFFLQVRYGDTHTPYRPPPEYRNLFYDGDPTVTNRGSLDPFYRGPGGRGPLKEYLVGEWLEPAAREWPGASGSRIEDIEWCRAQYDSGLRAADDGVRELVEHLGRRQLLERTAVIVLGDHGESLGEHGIYFEHHGLYECTLRPPLIALWPGAAAGGKRIRTQMEIQDLGPTILELLGFPRPPGMEGRSLAAVLGGRAADDDSPSWAVACECTWMFKWCLRKGSRKLIVARHPDMYRSPHVELYDLDADLREERNLAAVEPGIRDALIAELEDWIAARVAATGHAVDPVAELGRERSRRLAGESALGTILRLLSGRGSSARSAGAS
jgi:arylsulfatase A-like enzyme